MLRIIREKFSAPNPVYIQRRFRPREYVIMPSGVFQVGLWNDIHQEIKSLNIPVEITLTKEFKQHFSPKLNIEEIEIIDGYDYYDYQEISIKEFLKNGRGISIVATGGGKTLIMGGLCKTLIKHNPNIKILIVVPNTLLLNQSQRDFEYKFDLNFSTTWGDSQLPDLSKNVIIANSQILVSDIKRTLGIVQNFDIVIVDEVHTLGTKANKINKVIKNIHTDNKFGLTGTLPDNLLAGWNVIGKIGPILYEKTSYELRQQGTVTDLLVKIILCKHSKDPEETDSNEPNAKYIKEQEFLYNNIERNQLIHNIVEKVDKNILVVVDRIEHGLTIKELLKNSKKQVHFIRGSTDNDARTCIKQLMENNDNVVCIAMAQIFSVGVSINNLHYVICCMMGKSKIRIMQTIGRSMRLHENKNKAIIFDIADSTEYSLDHLKKRIELFKDEKIKYTITKTNL